MITIFTRKNPPCHFCENAKAYLHTNQIPHREIVVGEGGTISLERFKADYPEARTFPYVINGYQQTIGGFRELKELMEDTARSKLLLE